MTEAKDEEKSEIIEEGPVSIVSRTYASIGDAVPPQWLAVKSATIVRKFSKEPHDIKKELRILSAISHPNIISILKHASNPTWSTLNIWMPYIPIALPDILASTRFSPHPYGALLVDAAGGRRLRDRFETLARSMVFQVLTGLAFLHAQRIAHRDVKPSNILFTREGCAKIIDFGIVWKEEEMGDNCNPKRGDLWPEYEGGMYFEVSTGPYRAPELLFGPRTYDPFAIDLWSAGATISEFFTPLRLRSDGDDDEEEDAQSEEDEDEGKSPEAFIMPRNPRRASITSSKWDRDALFDSTRGELGLVWSIFKTRGTPTKQTWPDFGKLPDAGGVNFTVVPGVTLASLLPHLPLFTLTPVPSQQEVGPGGFSDDDQNLQSHPLDLLSRFLVYPAEKRLKVDGALSHPWFGDEILLPKGSSPNAVSGKQLMLEWEGKTLGEWLRFILTGTEDAKDW